MRIKSLNIPEKHVRDDGLDKIVLKKLSQIVLVIGKNGSGKSRLLNKIFDTVLTSLQNLSLNSQICEIDFLGKGTSVPVRFIPKYLNLKPTHALPQNDIKGQSENATQGRGVDSLHESCLSKILIVYQNYIVATHPNLNLDQESKEKYLKEFNDLNLNIKSLLGFEVNSNKKNGECQIGECLLDEVYLRFSDGQRCLLMLAVALHCQAQKLSDVILFLDEPENHLHPQATIEIIEKLKERCFGGQLWIATHSISVIAHFWESSTICFLNDGKASTGGEIQEKVMESLLGDSKEIGKQFDFLHKPDQMALVRFASECLLPSPTIMTGSGDPQNMQIRDRLSALISERGKIKVLDYGSGKGRLLNNLAETMPDFVQKIDYFCIDSSEKDKDECLTQIKKLYSDETERWFKDVRSLLSSPINKESFDLIVMCNVLHEISPSRWNSLFGSNGELTNLLKDSGQLLIVEDHVMKFGENAHEYGYLVLDTASLKDLFKVLGDDAHILVDVRKDRLKAHLIPKEKVKAVDKDSVKSSVESHLEFSQDKIDAFRNGSESGDGRKFAFWLVQYANATMALKAFN